jgi:hypothetical protein
VGERPLHTRKVAGSIPAGTTYVVAVRIWYLVLRNKCDVISVLSGSVLPQNLKDRATAGTAPRVWPNWKELDMPKIVLAAAAVAAMVVAAPGTAHADPAPTPAPSPPYVIQTPAGPTVGGLRTLPPICAAQPRACDLTWNPDTGSWQAPGTG